MSEDERFVLSRNGWYFKRHNSDLVEVRCTGGVAFLDPSQWAFVIATMSWNGNSPKTYRHAYNLHQGIAPSADTEEQA